MKYIGSYRGSWLGGRQMTYTWQHAMFYPNTYLNFNANGEYTKHYYNGNERIASRLGENAIDITLNNTNSVQLCNAIAEEHFRADVQQLIAADAPVDMPPVLDILNLQPTETPNNIFYYHINHLGSTSFVTDQNQTLTQGFLYAPHGEIGTEYNVGFGNNLLPKRAFNGKELDEETGMYYYEARYYAPPMFTSRDPMFEKYFWMSPYAYCANNPVKYVDPSGEEMWQPEITESGAVSYVAEKGDSKASFQRQYAVTKKAADKIFENAGISDVKVGTRISGNVVAQSVTNKTGRKYDDVLKLNWNNATDAQKVYHVMFALLCNNVRGGDVTDMNQFIQGLPENTGDASCMKVYGLTQIPLTNGERMNITVYNASFSKRFSKLANPQELKSFSNNYFGEQWNHQFTQPSDNAKKAIRRLLIGFEAQYYDKYTKSYYK